MPVKRHPLARLIDETKDARGLSDEDIARNARRHGYQISKQHIANLRAQDPLKSLVPATLRALAAGMELPLPRIVEAALPSAGLPTPGVPDDWSIEAAVEADPGLPVAAKRMLLSMLTSARGDTAAGRGPMRPPVRTLSPRTAPAKTTRRHSEEKQK